MYNDLFIILENAEKKYSFIFFSLAIFSLLGIVVELSFPFLKLQHLRNYQKICSNIFFLEVKEKNKGMGLK